MKSDKLKLKQIKTVIHKITGIPEEVFLRDSRLLSSVSCRKIFYYQGIKNGISIYKLAEESSKDIKYVKSSLDKYESDYKYNPIFRRAANRIDTELVLKKL